MMMGWLTMARKHPSWAIHTNIGRNPLEMAILAEQERMSAAFDADAQLAEQRALVGATGAPDQCPRVVEAGSQEDVENEFGFSNPGWTEADQRLNEKKQLREALAYGNIRPAQILTVNGVLAGPKMRNETELGAIAIGLACWRCGDAQPQERHIREERHVRLRDTFPNYSIPSHLTIDDCCCTCGAELGLRETRVA